MQANAANDSDRSSRPPNVDGRESNDDLSPETDAQDDNSNLDDQVMARVNGGSKDMPMPGSGEEAPSSNPNAASEEGREPRLREDADAADEDTDEDEGEVPPDGTGAQRS